jgi:predicted alpha/beta-fold hydrolase
MNDWSAALSGHYWTLRPFLQGVLPGASRGLDAQPWSLSVADPMLGSVRLSGRLFPAAGSRRLLLALHGLGGSAESSYLREALRAAHAAGMASLCLNLRGADGSGEDLYHAALTSDLHAALGSPELASFAELYVLGFSLGGHLTLRLASEPHDPRIRAAAAICAPLDLAHTSRELDSPERTLYRNYILRRLKACYVQVARRRALPTPLERVLRIKHLREWDELTVVPRFGFQSVDRYYQLASAAAQLSRLRARTLLVEAEHDPMVQATSDFRPTLTWANTHRPV